MGNWLAWLYGGGGGGQETDRGGTKGHVTVSLTRIGESSVRGGVSSVNMASTLLLLRSRKGQ